MSKSELKVIASMSGGGKSTYAESKYNDRFILPDTNKSVYSIYETLVGKPSDLQGIPCEELTSYTLWATKMNSDLSYLKGLSPSGIVGNFLQMRSGWDYLIFDELFKNRKVMSEDIMYNFIHPIESQFDSVKYEVWYMEDRKIISELMAVGDSRARLFQCDVDYYMKWQDYYVKRYEEILTKFNYDYLMKSVKYS